MDILLERMKKLLKQINQYIIEHDWTLKLLSIVIFIALAFIMFWLKVGLIRLIVSQSCKKP